MAIARVDIIDQNDGQARLEIWPAGGGSRVVLLFPSRTQALHACNAIWDSRKSQETIEELRRLALKSWH